MLKQSRNALTCLAKRYRAVLRRCRLRALALALACALTALPPLPAGAENTGGTWSGNDYIGTPTIGEASGATVDIDSDVPGYVSGGETRSGDATSNTVIISGGTMGYVCGGLTVDSGNATSNRVIISGGTVSGYVYGGDAGNGIATSNTVIISGGTVAGDVYGGDASGGSIATGNRVILSGAPTLTGIIFGGDAFVDAVSGNLLEVRSSGLQAKNIKNFAEYAFVLPATIRPGAVLLTLTQATDLTNGGQSPSPDIQRIDVDGAASPLRVGDKVTLFRNDNGLTPGTLPTSVSGTQGVTL
ncbi:MAG TPA: hypothetical protein H9784_03670, partial [Candidatus Desulfovibrio intestinavium]|nr:hypothetical protein [Candidatus Desulfovibrio intestinavium]